MKRRRQLNAVYIIMAILGTVAVLISGWFYLKAYRMKSYMNAELGFSIKYPAQWSLEEKKNGAVAIFYAPLSSPLDIFQENVNLVVQGHLPEEMTLEAYTKQAIEQLQVVFMQNIIIMESEPFRFAGQEGYKLVFIGKGPEAEVKYFCAWALVNRRAYQFTYTSLSSDYDKYFPLVNRMLRSFKILRSSP